jgi:thioester reductase-like protein
MATIRDHLERRARDNPDKVVYSFVSYPDAQPVETTLSYGQLRAKARALAAKLQSRGISAGDRIIVPSLQVEEDFVGAFACIYAGAIFILLPPPVDASKALRFRSVIESAEPRLLLTTRLLNHVAGGPHKLASAIGCHPSLVLDVNDEGDAPAYRPVELSPESIAYIQYTSGSTNAPKGIVISHANVLANVAAGLKVIENNPPPRKYLLWAPVFHNVGLITAFSTIVANMSCVFMRPMDFMTKPVRWFERISHHAADYTFASNSAVNYCTRAIRREELAGIDLSSLVSLGNGSEPIDMATLHGFAEAFGPTGFRLDMFNPGYGLAEATSMVSASSSGPVVRFVDAAKLGRDRFVEVAATHPKAKEIVSVGKLASGNTGMLVDPETGEICGPGRIGELWLKGPSTAVGYWKNEEETRNTFGASHPEAKGSFLRTGDLAAIEDGHLFITGRLKELIIVNGHNLYSTDLHQTVKNEIPELKLAPFVTFSILQDQREKIVSVAELAPRDPEEFQRLAGEVASAISGTWEFAPDDVVFVPERSLPRTDTGKIQLLKTRQAYQENRLDVLFSLASKSGPAAAVVAPASETERRVLAMFVEVLRTAAPISTNQNFFLLGGDSIATAALAARIQQEYGIEIPLKHFLGRPTIAGVAEFIARVREGTKISELAIEKTDLHAECRLDDTIRPPRYDATFEAPRNIFLTGGTGFVGAYLIRELLERTKAKLHCLVRAENEQAAAERLQKNAEFYKVWKSEWRDRIVPVVGDVAHSLLGVSPAKFDELSRTVDTIYHSAALLNFVYPYTGLRDANVGGTAECIRLACASRPKYFHHISTFSVYDNPSYFTGDAMEDDPLQHPDGYFVGYIESKWVAEKLVQIAQSRGLAATVYRPGEVSGDVVSGIWKEDAVVRNLVSCVQLGAMPDVEARFRITPVDYVARGIALLSLERQSIGKAFNLANDDTKNFRELVGSIREFGYRVDLLPLEQWKERLFRADASNALKPLEALFRDEGQNGKGGITERLGRAGAKISVARAVSALRPHGVICPRVDSRLLTTYFRYFVEAGYLRPPPLARSPR